MVLVTAAICPHPPLLLPAVGSGVEPAVRAAARTAVDRLVYAKPETIVVVGADQETTHYTAGDCGSLNGFGVDLRIPLGSTGSAREPALPLSLTVGAWLLAQSGWSGDCRAVGVSDQLSAEAASALGVQIAAGADRVGLLVMGDGSARRSEKAPGWFDDRSAAFDAEVASALAAGDPSRLLALDGLLARELMSAGRASWQVLAGAAEERARSAELLADEAPFGVGYFVALWEADPPRAAAGLR